MKQQTVDYTHLGKTFEAYLAYDEKKKEKRPAVFIFHAWAGRDAFACNQAEKMAELGFVGIALDVYGKGVFGESKEEKLQLMSPLLEDRSLLLGRILSGVEAFKAYPLIDQNCLGAIGFCFGGLCALDLARTGIDFKGVASFHGALQPPENHPGEPIQAKILVLHGHDDPGIPPEKVRAFEEEMTYSRADWQVHIYGNTMHGFTNPEANDQAAGIVYSEKAAKRSRKLMISFFEECFA